MPLPTPERTYGNIEDFQRQTSGPKSHSHAFKWISVLVIVALIFFGTSFFWPQILNAYENVKSQVTTQVQGTLKQYSEVWNPPVANAPEENKIISAQFVNAVGKAPIDATMEITIKVDEDTALIPQCLLDGKQIETLTSPSPLTLLKSDTEQHFSVRCKSSETGKILSVKVREPVKISSELTLWTGKGNNLGILNSAQNHKSSYSLLLTTANDQPLMDGEYPLFVKIKRESSNAVLQSIDSLKVSTISSSVSIENCPDVSGDRSVLEKYLVNRDSDAYVIQCNLVVRTQNGGLVQQKVTGEISYAAEEEFKTALSQSSTSNTA